MEHYVEPVEALAQPIENLSFLDEEGERNESEDELDILFVDDKGESETENWNVLDA